MLRANSEEPVAGAASRTQPSGNRLTARKAIWQQAYCSQSLLATGLLLANSRVALGLRVSQEGS